MMVEADKKARVVSVQISKAHVFSKAPKQRIRLVENFGVEGDSHAGATDQHRYHVTRFGQHPNLRQVHLIPAELFAELSGKGHTVHPGELGENISTRNIDLLSLPTGTRLRLGSEAVIELTGLRNPCHQIEDFQPGLLKHVVEISPSGLIRRAGVMSIVLKGGDVHAGDVIQVQLPPLPHEPLMYRVPELELRINSIIREAEGVHSVELRAMDNSILPPFTAGSHIDLHLSPGLTRSYSLSNDPQERNRYVVSVQRSPSSRGGSMHVHEQLRVSDRLKISPPRNHFELDESAEHTVLIAGGIGITPLMAMIYRMERLGMRWELFFTARTRALAAFVVELQQFENRLPGRVHFHFNAEKNAGQLNLEAIVAAAPDTAHIYCCGPQPMLTGFEKATVSIPKSRIHIERFAGNGTPVIEGGFEVRLNRSNRAFKVERGSTILDTLLASGVDIPHSCKQGICGSCKVRVLEGLPDHRDQILTPEERSRNDRMLVCCSGSKTPSIVLDL